MFLFCGIRELHTAVSGLEAGLKPQACGYRIKFLFREQHRADPFTQSAKKTAIFQIQSAHGRSCHYTKSSQTLTCKCLCLWMPRHQLVPLHRWHRRTCASSGLQFELHLPCKNHVENINSSGTTHRSSAMVKCASSIKVDKGIEVHKKKTTEFYP